MRLNTVHCRWLLSATILLFGLGTLPAQLPMRTVKVDCSDVLKKMRHDISVDPGRLVLAMEDALTLNEVCVCPIVRGAVDLAGREPQLVSEIMTAAIQLLPAAAARITECVLLEAPEAAPEIKATLAKVLGEKALQWFPTARGPGGPEATALPASGKFPVGKESLPAPLADSIGSETAVEAPVTHPEVGVNGIYFTARPVAAKTEKSSVKLVIRSVPYAKIPTRRPVFPVTETAPD